MMLEPTNQDCTSATGGSIFHRFPTQDQFMLNKCRQISVSGFARGSL